MGVAWVMGGAVGIGEVMSVMGGAVGGGGVDRGVPWQETRCSGVDWDEAVL